MRNVLMCKIAAGAAATLLAFSANAEEWIMASGYHKWFVNEIEENRVLWPRLGVPAQQN